MPTYTYLKEKSKVKNVKKDSILGARESCPRSPDAGCHLFCLLSKQTFKPDLLFSIKCLDHFQPDEIIPFKLCCLYSNLSWAIRGWAQP